MGVARCHSKCIEERQHRRHLYVKRRYKQWRCEWGGWHRLGLDKQFPEGFELRRDLLLAGTWSALKPRIIGIPFERYAYTHNSDGAGIEVEGSGVLLGAQLTGMAMGGRMLEYVYLVTSVEGHYYHAPDFERQPREIPFPRIEEDKRGKPAAPPIGNLHRADSDGSELFNEIARDPFFLWARPHQPR